MPNETRPQPVDVSKPFPEGDPCKACQRHWICKRVGYCWWLAETPEEMANAR